MSLRRFRAATACAVLAALAGCTAFDNFWHSSRRRGDERDFTEESEKQWEVVGDEGRKDQRVEKDPDQWWRNYVMSEKARSIEENLGFE